VIVVELVARINSFSEPSWFTTGRRRLDANRGTDRRARRVRNWTAPSALRRGDWIEFGKLNNL